VSNSSRKRSESRSKSSNSSNQRPVDVSASTFLKPAALGAAVLILLSESLLAAETPGQSAQAQEQSVPASERCGELAPEVRELLRAMATHAQRIDYSGVVTLQRGGDMQVIEVSHAVSGDMATEQMERITGAEARVMRAGHPVSCIHPGQELLNSGEVPASGVCGLGSVYQFRISPGDRVAGREALRMRVEPKDMYRFGYVFELDRDTALLLKSTTLAEDQRVLEQFQFASLTMQVPASDELRGGQRVAHQHPQQVQALANGPDWDIGWIPEGFLLTDAAPATSPRKSYTDGLASFSVFLEPLSAAIKPGEGVQREGSTVAYTRGRVLQQRPMLVTVLGEIPTNTARMVADSVRLR
jgi:sigma-E factor negative regulatory protein RseB